MPALVGHLLAHPHCRLGTAALVARVIHRLVCFTSLCCRIACVRLLDRLLRCTYSIGQYPQACTPFPPAALTSAFVSAAGRTIPAHSAGIAHRSAQLLPPQL